MTRRPIIVHYGAHYRGRDGIDMAFEGQRFDITDASGKELDVIVANVVKLKFGQTAIFTPA